MEDPSSNIEPLHPQPVDQPVRKKRPGSVTILTLGVLIITVTNVLRMALTIKNWSFLSTLPGVSPWYMLLTGLVWTLAGAPLLWGLWRAKNWAPRMMQAWTLTYALYFWLDHVFMMDHSLSGTGQALVPVNWRFSAAASVISLAFVSWTISRRKVKEYFGIEVTSVDLDREKLGDNG